MRSPRRPACKSLMVRISGRLMERELWERMLKHSHQRLFRGQGCSLGVGPCEPLRGRLAAPWHLLNCHFLLALHFCKCLAPSCPWICCHSSEIPRLPSNFLFLVFSLFPQCPTYDLHSHFKNPSFLGLLDTGFGLSFAPTSFHAHPRMLVSLRFHLWSSLPARFWRGCHTHSNALHYWRLPRLP